MKAFKYVVFCAVAIFYFSLGTANAQSVDIKALATTVKQGGYVIVFRHGATNRDQADIDPLNHDNIAKQRQLSEMGRTIATQVGQEFKALQIPIAKTYTSKFNRAVETGQLLSASPQTAFIDITEGGLVVSPIENDRRADSLRKLASQMPDAGTNVLVVTHKPNIIDAFGKDWFDVKEGEASVFAPNASGKLILVARVQAVDWLKK